VCSRPPARLSKLFVPGGHLFPAYPLLVSFRGHLEDRALRTRLLREPASQNLTIADVFLTRQTCGESNRVRRWATSRREQI
jgi:hypothetical protein